jgi:predicted anti-sigma-YlaC factor YlaD
VHRLLSTIDGPERATMTEPVEQHWRYDERVAQGFRVERLLTWLGWAVLVLGGAGLALILVLLIAGNIGVDEALAAALGTSLATILSGATAYGAGTAVGLAAARLEINRPTVRVDDPDGHATDPPPT